MMMMMIMYDDDADLSCRPSNHCPSSHTTPILPSTTARINEYDEITAYNNDSYSIDTYSGE